MKPKTIIPGILLALNLIYCCLTTAHAQPELSYHHNRTPQWHEIIQIYEKLDAMFPQARLVNAGETDSGKPLHLFIIDHDSTFEPGQKKPVLFINNGIHPGESCGIDACIEFAADLLYQPERYSRVLKELTICIIPVHNVGGALNRSPYHRTNQNGPIEQGFRGNALNMDLNRDFIKLDTRNVRSLITLIRNWDPALFIDTHTSNGADYPYVLTLISTQKDKLEEPLSSWFHNDLIPLIFEDMQSGGYPLTPYVMPYRGFPENGLVAFYDHPRYTTGYASLFAIPGFTTEAHMFKTYSNRVKATRLFVESCAWRLADHHKTIAKLKREARKRIQQKTEFVIHRTLDTTQYGTITFRGFRKTDSISPVTGLPSFRFDQNSSWEKEIPYYDQYKTTKLIEAPDFYIIPSAWQEVSDRLRLNGVEMIPLEKDTTLFVEYYRIGEFETYPNPYNGHYKHYNTRVESFRDSIPFLEGDLMVPMNQISNQYIVEVLEPEADDSFFNWNFFDSILSRKEYFSSYVFDTLAVRLLENDPKLKDSFEQKQKEDAGFASSHRQQLGYIYENSPYSEKTYRRYPVMRFFNAVSE